MHGDNRRRLDRGCLSYLWFIGQKASGFFPRHCDDDAIKTAEAGSVGQDDIWRSVCCDSVQFYYACSQVKSDVVLGAPAQRWGAEERVP